MERGYFALWRKFQDHAFWKERRVFSKAEAWIDILWNAQWKDEPQDMIFGMNVLKQNYGECLKSCRTWSYRWNWSESKVRRFLAFLDKNLNQIRVKNESITTRIFVINYEQYDPRRQGDGVSVTHSRRTSDAQVTTNNKEKKEKKVKKVNKLEAPPWLDLELWKKFKEHRQRLRAPMTQEAEKRSWSKVLKLMAECDCSQDAIIGQSIENGWKGLFALKNDSAVGPTGKAVRTAIASEKLLREMENGKI
jgi:hypothetical protein